MKKNYIIAVVIFGFIGSISFAQEVESTELEKWGLLVQKFRSLSYGEWRSMSGAFKDAGDDIYEPLVELLRRDEDGEGAWRRIEWNQRSVAWILGDVGTEKAADFLLHMLHDTTLNLWGRIGAVQSLGRMQAMNAVDPLLALFRDREIDAQLRRNAARTLGDLQCQKAIPYMVEAFNEANMLINMGVIYALGKIGSKEAVDGLMVALKYTDNYVRGSIYSHLRKLKPEEEIELLLLALEDSYWGAREDAVKILLEKGEGISGPLVDFYEDNKTSNTGRWEVIRILGLMKLEKYSELFLEGLQDEDLQISDESAVALSRISASKNIKPLIALLKDGKTHVRESAGWVLGEMRVEKAIDPLIQMLADSEAGWMASISLGKIGSEKAVKSLTGLLKMEDVRRRRAAAWALGRIQSDVAAEALIESLGDEDGEVRMLSALALDIIGTTKALKAIENINYKK